MKKTLIILGLLFCIACEERAPQPTNTSVQDSVELSEPIRVETNRRVTLLPEAQDSVGEWLAYATAYNEVEAIKGATGNEIIQLSEPLVQIMESLHTTVPAPLQVTAVKARTNVLLTKAEVLHQRANQKNKNASEIFKAANDVIVEFDNFKLQLNELFLKTPEDFEQELDREFEESQLRDTIPEIPAVQQ